MHLEFVVAGAPISNQSPGPNLAAWRAAVAEAARDRWPGEPLTDEVRAVVIYFREREAPTLDLDNMAKPILDALQGVVYLDDRQVRQAELVHAGIGDTFQFPRVSRLITDNIQAGQQFVYVRIEAPLAPYPLPRQVDETVPELQ